MVSDRGVQPTHGDGTLTVDAAQGDTQRMVRRQPGSEIDMVLSYRQDGVYLTALTLANDAMRKEFRSDAGVPVLWASTTPAPWEWELRSTDGATTLKAAFAVDRAETSNVDNTAVPCVVIRARLAMKGDVDATMTQAIWQSTRDGKVVEQREDGEGVVGAKRYRYDWRVVLQGVNPS